MINTTVRRLGGTFFKGLAAILPAVVTVYLLWWLGSTAESILGGIIQWVLPESFYLPGLGLLAGVGLVFALGVLLQAWVFRRMWEWGEGLMTRLPVIKTIYGAVQDLMGFFSGDATRDMQQVVVVDLPGVPFRLLGIVTRQDFSQLPDELGGEDTIAVYTPMSYQIGGYTLMLPRDCVHPIDMSVEDAMRYAVTAGMSVKKTASPVGKND